MSIATHIGKNSILRGMFLIKISGWRVGQLVERPEASSEAVGFNLKGQRITIGAKKLKVITGKTSCLYSTGIKESLQVDF